MPLLQAQRLTKGFRGRCALSEVSIAVERGEVVGLIGPQEGGKSAVARMIIGSDRPDAGQILFDGREITNWSRKRRLAAGLNTMEEQTGPLPREAGLRRRLFSLFRRPGVEDSLLAVLESVPSRTLGRKRTRAECWRRAAELMEMFGLTRLRRMPVSSLSAGERRRVGLARALAAEPILLVLENPFFGIDPVTVGDLVHVIRYVAPQDVGILLVDHDYRDVLQVSDRAYLIRYGKVIAQGTPAELARDRNAGRWCAEGERDREPSSADESGPSQKQSRQSSKESEAGSIFISYRREAGSETARLLHGVLRQHGWQAFLDVEDLGACCYDENLLEAIELADNFVVILTPGAMERCCDPDDWLRKEIGHALATGRNIVPLMKEGFRFPPDAELPAEIRELPRHNGVVYSHVYFDACVTQLMRFLNRRIAA